MRVMMPGTRRRPSAIAALDASGYGWEWRDVSRTDVSYFNLVSQAWRDGETFAVVEHDIAVGPGTLTGFEACEHDWCAAPYPYVITGTYAGLGCCKFSEALIARHPDALEVVATMSDPGHRAKHWCRLDGWLRQVLEERGERMHLHEPVRHLGDNWPSHGCVPKPMLV